MESPEKRKKSQHNIVLRLINRKTGSNNGPGTHFHTTRKFYQNVFPNFTVAGLDNPPCFLRKFTPNGKYLIAFSFYQCSLERYTYQGPAAAADLFHQLHDPNICEDHYKKLEVELKSRFFKLKHVVHITNEKQLNPQCSLFTHDGRYVVVGATTFIPEANRPHFYDIFTICLEKGRKKCQLGQDQGRSWRKSTVIQYSLLLINDHNQLINELASVNARRGLF